jgi:hypothetical protein
MKGENNRSGEQGAERVVFASFLPGVGLLPLPRILLSNKPL